MLCNCTRFEFDLKLIGNCSETASNSYQNRQCLRIWMKQCWFLEWNNYRRTDSGRFSDALHFRRAAACCMNNKEKIAASGTALGTPFSQLNVWEMEEKKKRPTIKINSSGTARKLHWNPRNWTSSYKSQVFKIPLETLMELPSKCSVVALYFRMVPRRNKTARKLLLKCSGMALEGNTTKLLGNEVNSKSEKLLLKCSVVALYLKMVPRRNKTARKLLLNCSGTAMEGNTTTKLPGNEVNSKSEWKLNKFL